MSTIKVCDGCGENASEDETFKISIMNKNNKPYSWESCQGCLERGFKFSRVFNGYFILVSLSRAAP